jgi:DNA-binding MarR family transcriptional regulator
MPDTRTKKNASKLAELTFQLLADCQHKEEKIAKQLKITVSEFRCIRVFRGEKHLPIKHLVERINLSGSRLTRILESLEEHGFVTRSIDPTDRRSITVTLTKKGVTLSETLESRYLQIHEEILEGIPKEMHTTLITGLHNMLVALESWLYASK